MRNPRACLSLAQHSGDFVFILLCGLFVMPMPTSHLKSAEGVGGAFAESKKTTVQPVPKPDAAAWSEPGRKFNRQWAMPGARNVSAKLFLVGREDADTAPSS